MNALRKEKIDLSGVQWEYVLPHYIAKTHLTTKGWGPCPFCTGENTYRIFFHNRNGGSGWYCSKCHEGGDFVGLIHRVTEKPFADIFHELETGNYNAGRPIIAKPAPLQKHHHEKSPEDCRRDLRAAWQESRPVTADSPVWRYLSGRIPGLKLEWLGPDVRWHPGMDFWHDNRRQGAFPVMLQRVISSSMVARTLQRTYLTAEGEKVPFRDSKGRSCAKKQMQSPDGPAGGSIRLNTAVSRTLALTEGTETGLAVVAKYANRIEVRGMLDCGNLARADIDWSQYDLVLIFADRDKVDTRLGARPGEHYAGILASKLSDMGKRVRVIRPVGEKDDFCDIWIRQYAKRENRKVERAARLIARESARPGSKAVQHAK